MFAPRGELRSRCEYATPAGGPRGKWMANRVEKTDAPITSSEAKKSDPQSKKVYHTEYDYGYENNDGLDDDW